MVVGVAVAVAAINACWATVVSACLAAVAHAAADGCFLGIQRYKRRKDAVKAKLVALEEEDQVTEEKSEEPNEVILSQRSRAKELCGIFIIHAVSVLIGVVTFAILTKRRSICN